MLPYVMCQRWVSSTPLLFHFRVHLQFSLVGSNLAVATTMLADMFIVASLLKSRNLLIGLIVKKVRG